MTTSTDTEQKSSKSDIIEATPSENGNKKSSGVIKREYDWLHVLIVLHLHLISIYSLYLLWTQTMYTTILYTLVLLLISTLGVTAGAHRLWAHRSYEANTKLRVLLMLAYTLIGHGTIYNWVLKHRLHHKYLGTEKDPYNIKKGFFHAHFLSQLQKPTPEDDALAKEIDMSDIEADQVVMFQKKFFLLLFVFVSVLLPINTPMEYWGESMLCSFFVVGVLYHCLAWHMVYLISSSIIIWGLESGGRYPADTNLVFIVTKSHWPQYHYLTPWDYQTGEFGNYGEGCTTTFIRIWAAMGWAYGLRTIDTNSVKDAIAKSLENGLPIETCLEKAALENKQRLENHYLYVKS